jgi:uncharacterized protein
LKRLLAFVLALLAFGLAVAQGVLPVPELTARVIDQTGTLDAIQRKGLEEKLACLRAAEGHADRRADGAHTQPEDIASYANRVANSWKIGRKAGRRRHPGVVAKDDRKVRIEVAKTLEGAVPDLAAKMIIDDAITPKFRQGDFAGGLQAGGGPADRARQRRGAPAPRAARVRSSAAARGLRFLQPRDPAVLRRAHRRRRAARHPGPQAGSVATAAASASSPCCSLPAWWSRRSPAWSACCSRCCPAAVPSAAARRPWAHHLSPAAAGAAVAAEAVAGGEAGRLRLRRRW